jgi:hypothetical protein
LYVVYSITVLRTIKPGYGMSDTLGDDAVVAYFKAYKVGKPQKPQGSDEIRGIPITKQKY